MAVPFIYLILLLVAFLATLSLSHVLIQLDVEILISAIPSLQILLVHSNVEKNLRLNAVVRQQCSNLMELTTPYWTSHTQKKLSQFKIRRSVSTCMNQAAVFFMILQLQSIISILPVASNLKEISIPSFAHMRILIFSEVSFIWTSTPLFVEIIIAIIRRNQRTYPTDTLLTAGFLNPPCFSGCFHIVKMMEIFLYCLLVSHVIWNYTRIAWIAIGQKRIAVVIMMQ